MPMPRGAYCNCWLSVIQLAEDCPVSPLQIMEALEADDTESRPVWKPMHLQPVFADCEFVSMVSQRNVTDETTGADNSVGGQIFARGVCLPSDSKMTDGDLERVCGVIEGLWG